MEFYSTRRLAWASRICLLLCVASLATSPALAQGSRTRVSICIRNEVEKILREEYEKPKELQGELRCPYCREELDIKGEREAKEKTKEELKVEREKEEEIQRCKSCETLLHGSCCAEFMSAGKGRKAKPCTTLGCKGGFEPLTQNENSPISQEGRELLNRLGMRDVVFSRDGQWKSVDLSTGRAIEREAPATMVPIGESPQPALPAPLPISLESVQRVIRMDTSGKQPRVITVNKDGTLTRWTYERRLIRRNAWKSDPIKLEAPHSEPFIQSERLNEDYFVTVTRERIEVWNANTGQRAYDLNLGASFTKETLQTVELNGRVGRLQTESGVILEFRIPLEVLPLPPGQARSFALEVIQGKRKRGALIQNPRNADFGDRFSTQAGKVWTRLTNRGELAGELWMDSTGMVLGDAFRSPAGERLTLNHYTASKIDLALADLYSLKDWPKDPAAFLKKAMKKRGVRKYFDPLMRSTGGILEKDLVWRLPIQEGLHSDPVGPRREFRHLEEQGIREVAPDMDGWFWAGSSSVRAVDSDVAYEFGGRSGSIVRYNRSSNYDSVRLVARPR